MATSAEQIAALQRENNQMYKEVAQAQMDFQREMSNTAHVRETKDLIAAGLNPVLSAGAQGATTPNGAQADVDAQSMVSYLINEMNNENAERMNSAQVAAQKYAALMSYKASQEMASAQRYAAELNQLSNPFGFAAVALTKPGSIENELLGQFLGLFGIDLQAIYDKVKSVSSQGVTNTSVVTGPQGITYDTKTGKLDLSTIGKTFGQYQDFQDSLYWKLVSKFPKAKANVFRNMVNELGLWNIKQLRSSLMRYYRHMNFNIPKYYQ